MSAVKTSPLGRMINFTDPTDLCANTILPLKVRCTINVRFPYTAIVQISHKISTHEIYNNSYKCGTQLKT